MLISSSSPSLNGSNPLLKTALKAETGSNPGDKTTHSVSPTLSSLSGVAEFAFAMQVDSLNYNHNETTLAYRKDNSLALRASTSINFKLQTEQFRFDITLTAESLGLDQSMFADPTKPLTIQLHYNQSTLNVSHKLSIKEVKTIRTPQEIIQDLVEGITEALRDPENKSIMYTLDEEAMASLIQSDAKMAKLFTELVMIMNMVNLMKKQNEESHDYVIHLSGKGKPYMDIQEEMNGEELRQDYQINITVLPPNSENSNAPVDEKTINAEPESSLIQSQDSPAQNG